jgi:hypothetical protein
MARIVCEHWNEINNCEECGAMKIKKQRWYEIVDGMAHIYGSGYKQFSQSVSIVPISDLSYYRDNFKLNKVWED